MVYCDGNSFSGNRDEPVNVKGLDGKVKPIYFRGRRIIDETLKALSTSFGLSSAKNVLLTGCSAGGLATYLHTDYVHDQLVGTWAQSLEKFKAASISGFFLYHNNVEDKPVYQTQMQNIFNLANSTHGLNDACIAAQAPGDEWKCNLRSIRTRTQNPTHFLSTLPSTRGRLGAFTRQNCRLVFLIKRQQQMVFAVLQATGRGLRAAVILNRAMLLK